jgi:hypothetical protein
MQTTIVGKKNSNCQEMGETREPMAYDCWLDAQRLSEKYRHIPSDHWVCFAAKPHTAKKNCIVMGWEVVFKRPSRPVVGMLVFHWDRIKKHFSVDERRSLPYDIPLSEDELSGELVPSLAKTAEESGAILLA